MRAACMSIRLCRPPHECLLRTSLMATHTHALIDEAVGVIAEVLRRYAL